MATFVERIVIAGVAITTRALVEAAPGQDRCDRWRAGAEAAQFEKDTVNVGPGERYDVIRTTREPGKWLLHCDINHHVTNDNVEEEGGGGLMLILDVAPWLRCPSWEEHRRTAAHVESAGGQSFICSIDRDE